MWELEKEMLNWDNSVLQREEASNELEALSYEAKKIEDEPVLTYFKRQEGRQIIEAAKANIEWLYSEEAKTASLVELKSKITFLKDPLAQAKHRQAFHEIAPGMLKDLDENIGIAGELLKKAKSVPKDKKAMLNA